MKFEDIWRIGMIIAVVFLIFTFLGMKEKMDNLPVVCYPLSRHWCEICIPRQVDDNPYSNGSVLISNISVNISSKISSLIK